MQATELPHQRSQGASHRQQGQPYRMTIPIHGRRCQQQGKQAKYDGSPSAVGNVTDLLGKTNDLNFDIAVFEFLTDLLFQNMVIDNVVNLDAIGIELIEFGGHHGAGLITCDQRTAELALTGGALNVGNVFAIQQCWRDGRRNEGLGAKTVFGNFVDETIGSPQRLYAQTRYVRQQHDRLRHVIQTRQRGLVPDRAAPHLDYKGQAVGAEYIVLIFLEGADVFMPDGHLFFEAGIHTQLKSRDRHQDSESGQNPQNDFSVVKK